MITKEQEEWEAWEEICEMFADLACASEYEHDDDVDQDSGPTADHPHTEGCIRRDANGIHYYSVTNVWTKYSTRRRRRQESEE